MTGRSREGTTAPAAGWQRAALAFASAVESGRLDLPLPGSGSTRERRAAFAALEDEDLSLARLGEWHADAVAILAELGGTAGQPPDPVLSGIRRGTASQACMGPWLMGRSRS